jgi:integrase
VKIGKLRVERRLLTLLDDAQMRALIGYKPKTFRQARVHLAALLILDTGLRISEVLNLRDENIDCDNLVLKVFGKGQKERLVPFSPELRRRIYRYQQLRARKEIAGEFSSRGSREPGGRSGTAPAPCISYKTGWACLGLAGIGCGIRSRRTTSGMVGTSCGCRLCWDTRRSQPRSATCPS